MCALLQTYYLLIHSLFLPFIKLLHKRTGWKIRIYWTQWSKIKYISLPSNFSTTSSKIPDLNKILNTILATDSFERFKKNGLNTHMCHLGSQKSHAQALNGYPLCFSKAHLKLFLHIRQLNSCRPILTAPFG